MILLILLPIIIMALTIAYFYYQQRSKKLRDEIIYERNLPYNPEQPSFIYVMLLRKRIDLLSQKFLKKLGKIYAFDMLGQINIVIGEPDIIQQILSKEFTSFPNRRKFTSDDPFFSKALSVVELDQWKRLRAIVAPTFATGKLRRMKTSVDNICQTLIKNVDDGLKKSDDHILNIKEFAGAFTMDTVITVAFGIKVDSLIEPDNPVITNVKKIFGKDLTLKDILITSLVFFGPKYLQKLFPSLRFGAEAVDYFDKFSRKIIEDKKKEFAQKDFTKATNFIEFLLEAEHEYEMQQKNGNKTNGNLDSDGKPIKYITVAEMIAQCVLFFIAGYDTTATTITMASYYLALNPDKQQKAYDDIVRVMKEENVETLESLPFEYYQQNTKLEYINGCINETLRLTPPAPFLERRCMNDITLKTEDGKYQVKFKKEDIVQIPVWYLHYNEEYFPEPEKFQPERFLPKTADNDHLTNFPKYAYLPFGSGPRACVAKSLALLEAKMALTWLIYNYKFSKTSKTPVPIQFYNQGGLLSPKNTFLKVEKRQ